VPLIQAITPEFLLVTILTPPTSAAPTILGAKSPPMSCFGSDGDLLRLCERNLGQFPISQQFAPAKQRAHRYAGVRQPGRIRIRGAHALIVVVLAALGAKSLKAIFYLVA
jgi:hypothetical protein